MSASVALVCPEPRLRRILALELEADGLAVVDCAETLPIRLRPAVIVADLDSLGWDPARAIGRLAHDPSTPILFVSVYPQQLEQLTGSRQLALLQPPFGFRDLTSRVRALLYDNPPTADGHGAYL